MDYLYGAFMVSFGVRLFNRFVLFENTLSLRVAYFTVNVYVQCSQLDLLPYKLIYHKYFPIIVSVDLQQATDAVYRQYPQNIPLETVTC